MPNGFLATRVHFCNIQIQGLCENVVPKEKDNESSAAKVKNLLHLFVSKRDILYQFLQKNIHSSEDFGWRFDLKTNKFSQ
jgi:hypothetical protein